MKIRVTGDCRSLENSVVTRPSANRSNKLSSKRYLLLSLERNAHQCVDDSAE